MGALRRLERLNSALIATLIGVSPAQQISKIASRFDPAGSFFRQRPVALVASQDSSGIDMRHSAWLWIFAIVAASTLWSTAQASTPALDLARQVLESADHRSLPFAVIDKQAARILVFRSDGSLAGVSPALLGQTVGDQSVPGVGERTRSGRLRSADRTTPSGRYVSEPGHNLQGEPIVWIDYANALAIHRLRPGRAAERRAQRLASMNAAEMRISAGCVVVPVAFYEAVVQPLLGHGRGVVYVMPESGLSQGLSQGM